MPRRKSKKAPKSTKKPGQHLLVGNIGLYYVAYKLSARGWNVVPTSRNARGVDLLLYDDAARRRPTVQVKTLTKRDPVPLGSSRENLFADFYVACVGVGDPTTAPRCYVMTCNEICRDMVENRARATGKPALWLAQRDYEAHLDRWDKIDNFET